MLDEDVKGCWIRFDLIQHSDNVRCLWTKTHIDPSGGGSSSIGLIWAAFSISKINNEKVVRISLVYWNINSFKLGIARALEYVIFLF
jgi:hypothetical protein